MATKPMTKELIAIRDALKCGCCEKTFKGTDSQARRVKYEHSTVYCSKACRRVAMRKMGFVI
jgi:hypothetical protein